MGGGSSTLGFYLASGPLSIRVVEGVVEVLGFPVGVGSTIVIPLGRSVSVRVSGSLSASDLSKLKPLDASVYNVFDSIAGELSAYERILLVGPTDSGKSTLAAWISNRVALRGSTAYYLTTDVGQNEVFCPGFEALAKTSPPVVPGYSGSFTDIKPCFVGSFTPSDSIERYISCASRLAMMAEGPLVVDTDGWASGEGVRVKARLAEEVGADVIVAIGLGDNIMRYLENVKAKVMRLPKLVEGREKTVEERRVHRERLITLRLLGARQVKVKVDEVEVEGAPIFKGKPLEYNLVKNINPKLVYAEQQEGVLVAIYKGVTPPSLDGVLIPLDWEKNLLAAVHCNNQVRPAVIERIDYKTRSIVLYTTCNERIERIEVGKVRVNINKP
jgi:polynucleotide 5'-hydroxyl-kinase GRC3/NOL9